MELLRDLWQFLDQLSRALSLLIVIAAPFVFFCRQWILEWIKSRFTRGLTAQAERLRHELATELEIRKIGLLRELEQAKVATDLQRSVALQVASAKIEAIRKLVAALSEAGRDAVVFPRLAPPQRAGESSVLAKSIYEARIAVRDSEVFFPIELVVKIMELLARYHSFLHDYTNSQTVLPIEHPTITEAIAAAAEVSNAVKCELAKAGTL